MLLVQPTLFDSRRAFEGTHVAWTYRHVPNGSTDDMVDHIEWQRRISSKVLVVHFAV